MVSFSSFPIKFYANNPFSLFLLGLILYFLQMGTIYPLKIPIPIPKHKLNVLCVKECSPSLNHDRICNGVCFQVCPLLCKTLSLDVDFLPPNPIHLIPPNPIHLIPPLVPARPVTETGNISQSNMIVASMMTIAALIVAAILVSIFCCFLRFHYLRQRRERREGIPPVFFGTQEDFLDGGQGPGLDHHTWYINRVGLQQSVIDLIAVFKYKKDELLTEGTECSVCLSEFEEDDSLKLLPKCSHAFHIPCIDTWLRSHKNCPLCRSPIVSDDFDALSSVTDSSSSSEFQMENSDSGNGVVIHQIGEEGTSEAGNEDDPNCSLPREDETTDMNSEMNMKLFNLPSKPNTHVEGQTLRRSVSFDSSSAVVDAQSQCQMLGLKHSKSKNNGSLRFQKLMESSSAGKMSQKGPISMKRSFSSTAKSQSPLFRHTRSHDLILPL